MTLLERMIFTNILNDTIKLGMELANGEEKYHKRQIADQIIDNVKALYAHPDLSREDKLLLRNSLRFLSEDSSCGWIFNTLDDVLNK